MQPAMSCRIADSCMRREMAVHLYSRANGEEDASGPHATTVLRYKKTSMDSISFQCTVT